MKKIIISMFFAIMLLFSSGVQAQEYIMSPGDQLDILFMGHPDLSSDPKSTTSKYIVRPDGKIAFPLVGDVDTRGLTIPQFTEKLQTEFAEYLRDPQITVSLIKLGTTRVFVFGEVRKAGLHELTKSHRVMDAIGMAEGFTKDAAKKKIFLIRQGQSDAPIIVNFNNLLTKGEMNQNYVMNEGDALYLTGNGRIDFARDIMPFVSGWYMVSEIRKNNK